MNDDERTPIAPHARPSPVVVRAGQGGDVRPWVHMPPSSPALPTRAATPKGGTLAPLGAVRVTPTAAHPVPGPEVFSADEEPTASRATPIVVNRLIRNYLACSPADQRVIEALALRLRKGVGE